MAIGEHVGQHPYDLMIENYLTGEVKRRRLEKHAEGSLEEEYLKPVSGKPFKSMNNNFRLDWVSLYLYRFGLLWYHQYIFFYL